MLYYSSYCAFNASNLAFYSYVCDKQTASKEIDLVVTQQNFLPKQNPSLNVMITQPQSPLPISKRSNPYFLKQLIL